MLNPKISSELRMPSRAGAFTKREAAAFVPQARGLRRARDDGQTGRVKRELPWEEPVAQTIALYERILVEKRKH